MSSPSLSISERLRRFLQLFSRSRSHKSETLYDDILYLSSRTESLDELLTLFPERICAALELSSFRFFLRGRTGYVLQVPKAAEPSSIALPSSSSTVLRMKRDRNPALFTRPGAVEAETDGWQLLATASEVEILSSVDAQVLVPLEGRTGLMGFVTLARAQQRTFSRGELKFLADLGPQMGRGLETAQLVRELSEQAVERARAHRELEVAREVQEGLLPGTLPSLPGMDIATAYRSAEQIGGDYYDVFLHGDAIYTVVADVSGKGVPAALLMAALRASLHALLQQPGLSITTLIEQLNGLLYAASSNNRYATLFLSVYDPAKYTLTYVNAGHTRTLLLRADRSIRALDCGGTVVGLLPNVAYASETLTLEEGDLLFAYTDGVTEATNAAGEEWGERGLRAAILETTQLGVPTSEQLTESLLRKLNDFTGGIAQADDITLVTLRTLRPMSA